MYIDFPMSQKNITLDSLLVLLLYKQSICKFSPCSWQRREILKYMGQTPGDTFIVFLRFPDADGRQYEVMRGMQCLKYVYVGLFDMACPEAAVQVGSPTRMNKRAIITFAIIIIMYPHEHRTTIYYNFLSFIVPLYT